jgi:sugar phosphate permease
MLHDRRTLQGLLIFLLLCLAYLFVPFHRVSPAVMALDIMRDLNLGAPAMGVLASVFFFTYGAMQLPSGLLADSLGPRRTLPLFFGLASLGAVVFGLADSFGALAASRALTGLGMSVVFICGIKLIGNWFAPQAFARLSGVYLGMGGVGLILGSGPMAVLCSMLGWRNGLMLSGGAGLVVALGLWIWVRDTPQTNADAPGETRKTAPDSAAGLAERDGNGGGTGYRELFATVRAICANGHFWLLATWFFCQFSIHMSFGGLWGGPFLIDVHGLTRGQAGGVLNMMGIGMLAGGPLAGWLSESVFHARKPVMLLNALGLVLLFAVLAQWGAELPLWALYLWFLCLAACGMGSLSVGFASVRDMFGDAATGTGGGLLNTLPSFGVALFQPLTGWILEHHRAAGGGFTMEGYSMSCLFYMAVALVGVLAALLLREPMRDRAATPQGRTAEESAPA